MIGYDGNFYSNDDFDKQGYLSFKTRTKKIFDNEKKMASSFQQLLDGDYRTFLDNFDFSTRKNKAFFWSGNRDRIIKLAEYFDWDIFNTTQGGGVLDNWDWLDQKFDWQLWYGTGAIYDPVELWYTASEKYTSHVSGNIGYYYEGYEGKTWILCEHPLVKYSQSLGIINKIDIISREDIIDKVPFNLNPQISIPTGNHSDAYLEFMEQISKNQAKAHSPFLYQLINMNEKAEIEKLIYNRLSIKDLGVLPIVPDIRSDRLIHLVTDMLNIYPDGCLAKSDLLITLHKLFHTEYYYDMLINNFRLGNRYSRLNILIYLHLNALTLPDLSPISSDMVIMNYINILTGECRKTTKF